MPTTSKPDLTQITPVRCPHPDCPWVVHGIPDHFVGSRNGQLGRHLADDHKPVLEVEPAEPVHDELWRHLDWSFWGTGMADEFREPLAEAMLTGITPEQRQQANDLITRWRDHREFVGRDKYEAQKAEIESLRQRLAEATEDPRVRLWLIEQYVTRITAADNPVAIGLDLTPWLDGPIHRDDVAAYRAARTTAAQEG